MSQADLQTVLSHIEKLQPEELREVGRAVEARLATDSPRYGDEEEAFLRALRDAGLISKINRPANGGASDFKPVPVRGKPVSETMIEERR